MIAEEREKAHIEDNQQLRPVVLVIGPDQEYGRRTSEVTDSERGQVMSFGLISRGVAGKGIESRPRHGQVGNAGQVGSVGLHSSLKEANREQVHNPKINIARKVRAATIANPATTDARETQSCTCLG